MANGRMVMNMQGFYRMIAFGVILFYVAIVLVIFRFALIVRLVPKKVKIPVMNGSLERIRAWLR